MGNRWHGWDVDSHSPLENAGDNQCNAMAAGGFRKRETGRVWWSKCLCVWDAHPHAPLRTPAHPGISPMLGILTLVTKSLIALKSGKQTGCEQHSQLCSQLNACSQPLPSATAWSHWHSKHAQGLSQGSKAVPGSQLLPKGGISLCFPHRQHGRMARALA